MKVKKVSKFWFFSLFFFVVFSCANPVKRHARLVKKFPHVHQQDTLIVKDTIRIKIPEIKTDTLFQKDTFMVKLNDTITIEKERLKVKLFRVSDTIKIEGSCDTIFVDKIIEREIPIVYYETLPDNKFNWLYFFSGVGLVLLLILLLLLLLKYFKNE